MDGVFNSSGNLFADVSISFAQAASDPTRCIILSLLKAPVESRGEFEFGDAQPVELKGLAGSHRVQGAMVVWPRKLAMRNSGARMLRLFTVAALLDLR